MSDYLQERLNRAREEGLRRKRSQPIPSFRGFQNGELLVSIDGKAPEQYGRYLGTGTPAIGDPLIEFRGAGGPLLRGSDRRPLIPERRVIVVGAPPPVGEWVYSNNEGLLSIVQNDAIAIELTYNTRPNTALWDGPINFYDLDGDLQYTSEYEIREVDVIFARYLTVTDPVRLTFTHTVDHLSPRFTTSNGAQSARSDYRFTIYTISTQLPLTSPNNIIADAIAQNTAGTAFVSSIIDSNTYLTNDGPNVLPPFDLDQPWNRYNIINQLDFPIFGVNGAIAGVLISGGTETTTTTTRDILDPGTYLLVGRIGVDANVVIAGNESGTYETYFTIPNEQVIWHIGFDTRVEIGPIPP